MKTNPKRSSKILYDILLLYNKDITRCLQEWIIYNKDITISELILKDHLTLTLDHSNFPYKS